LVFVDVAVELAMAGKVGDEVGIQDLSVAFLSAKPTAQVPSPSSPPKTSPRQQQMPALDYIDDAHTHSTPRPIDLSHSTILQSALLFAT